MYRCTDCKKSFLNARVVYEKHGLGSPPYERRLVCPICGGEDLKECEVRHCRCCGARLPEGRYDYCNEACRVRGERLWSKQAQRRKKRESDPLCVAVAAVELYNREHKTRLSYGQYISMMRKEVKNGGKKEIS